MKKTVFSIAVFTMIIMSGIVAHAQGFSTNNISDYSIVTNEINGGKWSYLYYDGADSGLLEKSAQSENWYYSADKTDSYYLMPSGRMCSRSDKQIIYNYTVGEQLDGRDVVIKGKYSGDLSTDLYVIKTDDTDLYGIILPEDISSNIIGKYSTADSEFEIDIPAGEIRGGNDILFVSKINSSGYVYNTLDATIEEVNYFRINNFVLSDAYGNTINEINKDGIRISAEILNHTYESADLCFGAAIYSEAGKLKKLKYRNYSGLSAEENNVETDFAPDELSEISENDYIKAFVWNNLKDMTPLTSAKIFPQNIYSDSHKVSDLTACNGNQTDMSEAGGMTWNRIDFAWQSVQPTEDGGFDEAQLKSWGDRILACKENGITMLPILDYTADWAADPAPYEYIYGGVTYSYGEAQEIEGDSTYWNRERTVIYSDGSRSTSTVKLRKSRQRFKDIKLWEAYVEKIVSTYSAEPYNLEYFQVWNEAHPSSSFWYGGMDYYITVLHKTAADIIRRYGCKVVYGGWPECGDIGEYCNLLDTYDAWKDIDVFDLHYFGTSAMNTLYNRALKAGVIQPCIWQTEVGWLSSKGWICGSYASMLSWALSHRSDKENQFKIFFFSWGAPNDPAAYGYGKVMQYTDGTLTYHGKSMKMFMDTLSADNIENYTAFSESGGAKISSVYGFEADSHRVVLISSATGKSVLADKEITCSGIYGIQRLQLTDYEGEEYYDIPYSDDGNGNITFTIPSDKLVTYVYNNEEKLYCYIIIDAEKIAAPENNISDYEFGSDKNNRSVITPGRWSYLDCTSSPRAMETGTGSGVFSAEEWTSDDSAKLHKSCVDAVGNIYAGIDPVAYNYTISEDMEGQDISVKGTFTPNSLERTLRIYKTYDTMPSTVEPEYELLYEYTGRASQDFSFTIKGTEVQTGNDIVFEVSSSADASYSKYCTLDATVKLK